MIRDEFNGIFEAACSIVAELKPNSVQSLRFGDWKSPYLGDGFEFAEVREFVVGDNPARIDPRSSLQAGELMVEVQHEQREMRSLVVLDLSPSMFLRNKLKAAYTAFVVLIASGLKQQIPTGLLISGDRYELAVKPRLGSKQLFVANKTFIDAISGDLDIEKDPRIKHKHKEAELDGWRKFFTRSSYVFVISDFLGERGEETAISLEERFFGYRVMPIIVQDDLEHTFPIMPRLGADVELWDPETGSISVARMNKKTSELRKEKHEKRIEELKSRFRGKGFAYAHTGNHEIQNVYTSLSDMLNEDRKKRR